MSEAAGTRREAAGVRLEAAGIRLKGFQKNSESIGLLLFNIG